MHRDPWHFSRTELANQTLGLLAGGPAQALTLFAPRRTGKTEFLLQDLGPLAEQQGHRVLYLSFWQAPLAPLAVLLHALETGLKRGSFADRAKAAVIGMAPTLRLSAPALGAKAEAEIDLTQLSGKPPTDLLLHLDALLDRHTKRRKATFLLMDEVQELARDSANHGLVAALRTGLDRRPNLKVVFTGSSREGLRALFSAREAPFFHFATQMDFPVLGNEFVDHLLNTFRSVSKRRLERETMRACFYSLHASPFLFRRLLEILLMHPTLPVEEALVQLRERVASELGYPELWLRLTPLQRATARVLAQGETRPFTRQARAAIGRVMGESAPTAARVQTALRTLTNQGVADNLGAGWCLEDPEFGKWLSNVRAGGTG